MKSEKKPAAHKCSFLLSKLLFFSLCLSMAWVSHASAKPGDGYSADKAVAYADSCFKESHGRHVKNPNSKYGDDLCAGYVSQCLKEGGMSMDSKWYWKSRQDKSTSWSNCSSLYNYLRSCKYKINYSPTEDDVQKGDVIFYYRSGRWGHVAICVGKSADGTPLINAYNNPHYHYKNWTLGYKTCVVSMESRTGTPVILQAPSANGKTVSLSCPTKQSIIYYTTDGRNPTTASNRYTKSFSVSENCTVKAIAVSADASASSVASAYIDIEKPLDSGTYYLRSAAISRLTIGVQNALHTNSKYRLMMSGSEDYNRKFQLTYHSKGIYSLTTLNSKQKMAERPAETQASPLPSATQQPETETVLDTAVDSAASTAAPTQLPVKANSATDSAVETTQSLEYTDAAAPQLKNANPMMVTGTLYQSSLLHAPAKWNIHCAGANRFYIANSQTNHYLAIQPNAKWGGEVYTTDTAGIQTMWKFVRASTSKLKATIYRTPGKQKNSKYLTLSGTITSNYKIESVQLEIYSLSSKKTAMKIIATPNTKKVSLYELAHTRSCNGLKKGKYQLVIMAYDASKQVKTLVKKQFRIVA